MREQHERMAAPEERAARLTAVDAVLAAIRADNLPVRVMLLTARQQESDIIRGFTLGADDYVVKPFSPMELVARLKRLVLR